MLMVSQYRRYPDITTWARRFLLGPSVISAYVKVAAWPVDLGHHAVERGVVQQVVAHVLRRCLPARRLVDVAGADVVERMHAALTVDRHDDAHEPLAGLVTRERVAVRSDRRE